MAFKGRRTAPGELISDNTGVNDSDVTNLAYKIKEKYTDKKGRLSVYVDNEVLTDFKSMAGSRMQSEIVEKLLQKWIDDVKAKENNTSWEIPE